MPKATARQTADTLLDLTQAYIDDAAEFLEAEIQGRREKALRYYEGENPDSLPVVPGRSSMVDPVVRDTIEWIMPSLMRVFTAGDQWIAIEPQGPEDAQKARAAEAWVNHVITRANPGYLLDYQWIRDCLLEAVGWQKVFWDVTESAERLRFEGVGAQELQLAEQQDGVRIDKVEERDDGLYNLAVTVEKRDAVLRIATVPPEEILYGQDCTLDRSSWWFICHKSEKRLAELRSMGFDVADDLQGPELEGTDQDERNSDSPTSDREDLETADPSARKVWLYECYLRHDQDGDGLAEWLKVMRVGDELLDVEEVDEPPLVAISPILRSHRLTGYSIADLIVDLQDLMTALQRSVNDSVYLGVNPRAEIDVTGMTEFTLNDYLRNEAGGYIRVRRPGTVTPLMAAPLPPATLALLERYDQKLEARTGVSRFNAGLSPDALTQTATGTALIQNAANQRIELIARNLAETGFKDRINLILRLSARHPDYLAQRTVQISGVPLQLTSDDLAGSYDLIVNTGIGPGNRAMQTAAVQQLLSVYQLLMQAGAGPGSQNPLFSTVNLYNALAEFLKLSGYRNTADFVIDPQNPNAPRDPVVPPQPSIEQILAQVETQKAQVQAMKVQAEQQQAAQAQQLDGWQKEVDARIAAGELGLKARELALQEQELALQMYKARADTNARMLEAQSGADRDAVAAVVNFEQALYERQLADRELGLKEREQRLSEAKTRAELGDAVEMPPPPEYDAKLDAVLAAMGESIQRIEGLRTRLDAPKKVERGPDGKVVSIGGRPVVRDASGRVAGIGE